MVKNNKNVEKSRGNRSLLRRLLRQENESGAKRDKPGLQIEQLEDRKLLAGIFIPAIGVQTGYFQDAAAYEEYSTHLTSYYGELYNPYGPEYDGGSGSGSGYGPGYGNPSYGGGSGLQAEGASGSIVTMEMEPNNRSGSGQLLGIDSRNSETAVSIINGNLANTPAGNDTDYYGMNLRGGDILDLRLAGTNGTAPFIELVDQNGQLIVTAFSAEELISGYPRNGTSPLTTDGNVSFAYVIPRDGFYQLRISSGQGIYQIRAQAFRNTIEQEPIGTVPELFLDFDGTVLDRSIYGIDPSIPTTPSVIPSFFDSVRNFGFTEADVDRMIDQILEKVARDFNANIPILGANGDFENDGIPGNFAFRLTNSRDHGERFGLPNVSRGIIGGSSLDFFGTPIFGVLGIAQHIDVGNFDREDTFIAMPENFLQLGIPQFTPLAPGVSQGDYLASLLATTISHEYGHIIGLWHTNPFNNIDGIMDPFLNTGDGPDGIHGSEDDVVVTFVREPYRIASPLLPGVPGEFLLGVEDQAATVSWNLASGTRGGTIEGTVFSDTNRNGVRNTGEFGIAGQTVFVDINNNGQLDTGEPRAVTDGGGNYSLRTPPGSQVVRLAAAANMAASVGAITVNVGLDQTRSNVNFGQFITSQTVTGYKWADINGNGVRDSGEPGIGGVYIYADLDGDNRPDLAEPAAITNADGSYVLSSIPASTFAIREVIEPGFLQTYPANGEHLITPETARPLQGLDFGNQPARDYGDLPRPYPTLAAENGPSHGIRLGLSLGETIDLDFDGQPSLTATGDDENGIDDEDGVFLLAPIVAGSSTNQILVNVTNTTGSVAYLQGWIDFDGNGNFNGPNEHIINDQIATSGIYEFFAPTTTAIGNVYARFRLSTEREVRPTGPAVNGEVEDYRFQSLETLRFTLSDDLIVERNSGPVEVDVLSNDPVFTLENFTARLADVNPGNRGTVTLEDGVITYTPDSGFVGIDIFSYVLEISNGIPGSTPFLRSETVTAFVDYRFDDPVAIDNSFDVAVNSDTLSLNVLANDVEGNGGQLLIQSVSTGNAGGTIARSSNGRQIDYQPAPSFEGTETFTYTVVDSDNKTSTATVTVHVLPGDRDNDDVVFSLAFRNSRGNAASQIPQGQDFFVDVFVEDIRQTPGDNAGVYAAYLDLLYNSDLVLPAGQMPGSAFDFDVTFLNGYTEGQTGSSALPGVIDELGAFNANATLNQSGRVRLATLRFNARAAGIVSFVPNPADVAPDSDVVLANNSDQPVPGIRIRYLRSAIEVIANPSEFPQAIDDSPGEFTVNSVRNEIRVLANDVVGANGPLRIVRVTQPANGFVAINDNGTPSDPTDDFLHFNAGATRGVETFQYTIIDGLGFESIGNVTVQVGRVTPDIQLRLEVTDTSGQPITSIGVNRPFQLRGYVKDLRTNSSDTGVFAAYQDILLSNSNLATINGASNDLGFSISFGANYRNFPTGDIRIPGLINEVGSQQSTLPGQDFDALGSDEFLQFIITLTAGTETGILTFVGDPADLFPFSDTLLFETVAPVDPSRIDYTDVSISIVLAGGLVGAGEGFTNEINRYDVNNDGHVSPIDVLAIINALNSKGIGRISDLYGLQAEGEQPSAIRRSYIDANRDGILSPLDALAVINHINARARQGSGEGEGEAASNVTDAVMASVATDDFDSVLSAVAIDVDVIKKGGTRA